MSETKFSLMRQFGSEQFSATVTVDDIASEKNVKNALGALNSALDQQFIIVNDREIHEKKILTERSAERQKALEEFDNQLRSENLTALKVSRSVK